MKKSLLATAVAGLMLSPVVFAAQLYDNGNTSITGSGAIGAAVVNTNSKTEAINGGSKVHLDFAHKLQNNWNVFGTYEWGVNLAGQPELKVNNDALVSDQKSDFFYNRLGFVGVSHPVYGSLAIGKMYGAWWDVVKDTDNGAIWDGLAAGVYTFKGDGGVNGVGRSDQTIQYRNTFGNLSVAIQAQVKENSFSIDPTSKDSPFPTHALPANITYKNTYGIGLRYQVVPQVTLTAGYNRGKFDIDYGAISNIKKPDDADKIYGGGIVLGDWDAPGFYAAANYNQTTFHDVDNIGRMIPSSKGVEAAASYLMDNGLRFYVQYDVLNAGDDYKQAYDGDTFKRANVIGSLQYQIDPQTLVYLEGRIDKSDFKGSHEAAMTASDDDGVGIGIKYSF
ncbi:porin [Parashewanella curva]|uniref:Porin n=1 Tax=Parashewanella curva TaxID=2338552 RepID=A0A3L8PYB8_9GAMM|nr:porin [Parashewanella curva]RLV60331.1 porin [Parashewanella curva]